MTSWLEELNRLRDDVKPALVQKIADHKEILAALRHQRAFFLAWSGEPSDIKSHPDVQDSSGALRAAFNLHIFTRAKLLQVRYDKDTKHGVNGKQQRLWKNES